ncbi:helix-turn-helix domain-containing protein [Salmonella enterica]
MVENKQRFIGKPLIHINTLIKHFSAETTRIVVQENKIIYYNKNNKMDCYLLVDGEVIIKTLTDRTIVARVQAPFIFGPGIDQNACLHTLVESTFEVLPTERAQSIIREDNLWEHMYYFFRWIASLTHQRVQVLKRPTSRQIILALLNNLQSDPSKLKKNISITRYIQENTSLSRSSIYNVIKELKEEGVISIRNGRLISSPPNSLNKGS